MIPALIWCTSKQNKNVQKLLINKLLTFALRQYATCNRAFTVIFCTVISLHICIQVASPFSLEHYFDIATTTCKKYACIKIYQLMLYQFMNSHATATASVSNTTILSILYMLQQAKESLQEIQVCSHTSSLRMGLVKIINHSMIITKPTALIMRRRYRR